MAAASDRFSIRDYAAKMRIVDLTKSWPFIGEKDEKQTLPPISICRFRWWTDELSSARSATEAVEIKAAEAPMDELVEKPDEIIEHLLPNSPPTATTEKTTEEEYLRSAKVKTRVPKKRSLIELFASAPQIEPVDQSNGKDGDGENKEEDEKVMKRKKKGKRRKGTIKMEIRALKKLRETFLDPWKRLLRKKHTVHDSTIDSSGTSKKLREFLVIPNDQLHVV